MKHKYSTVSILALLATVCLAISCGDNKGTDPVDPDVPVVTTADITTITRSSAVGGGRITSAGGAPVTASGICWCTDTVPLVSDDHTSDGADTGSFTSSITNLAYNTTYYVRAYATNSGGTGYGDTVSFTTLDSAYTVTDVNGNEYPAISIGTQVWMTENLKVGSYRNGTPITYISDNAEWAALNDGASCFYDNDPAYHWGLYGPYGSLYNWYAVNDSRGLAPEGWHIPSYDEWQTLIDYLGGTTVAGGKMKEIGTDHWLAPNTGATNESGFAAIPGGMRVGNSGIFRDMGTYAAFWSSSDGGGGYAWAAILENDQSSIARWNDMKTNGFSVRCVKD